MSRIMSQDAEKLKEFLNTYTLNSQFANSDFGNQLVSIHKKVFGYLIFCSEMEFQNVNESKLDETCRSYINESLSDIIQAYFCWINGAYKGANLLLRSSIETFIKAVIGITDNSVYVEKSVYKIFEMAEANPFLQKSQQNTNYSVLLHNEYGELCKYTHTATKKNMVEISALGMLPKFDVVQSKTFTKNILRVLNILLGFLLNNFPNIVYSMHVNNQRVFFEAIPNTIKKEILGAICN